MKLPRDVDYGRALDADVAWAHRLTSDADIYYVANISERDQDIDTRFRMSGKEAELFHPDRGTTEPAEYHIEGNRTTVPLRLAKHESGVRRLSSSYHVVISHARTRRRVHARNGHRTLGCQLPTRTRRTSTREVRDALRRGRRAPTRA
jgi:hypothetical protein